MINPKQHLIPYQPRLYSYQRLANILTCLALLILLSPRLSLAEKLETPDNSLNNAPLVTFKRLLQEADSEEALGQLSPTALQETQESLQAAGLSLAPDSTDSTSFALAATLLEAECAIHSKDQGKRSCFALIKWELYSEIQEQVIYRADLYSVQRNLVFDTSQEEKFRLQRLLLQDSAQQLLKKDLFLKTLTAVTAAKDAYEPATLKTCALVAPEVSKDASKSLDAVAVVESGSGFGSGFFITETPYLLTAAHVITSPKLKVLLHSGEELKAQVIRLNKKADVALLRLEGIESAPGCLRVVENAAPTPGSSVYALGSPASKALSFSISRGIISGVREYQKIRRIQTDASINPGNSGGPLINEAAEVVGVASSKLVGKSVEGIGFAVEIHDALQSLNLTLADNTSMKLTNALELKEDELKDPEPLEVITEPMPERPYLDPSKAPISQALKTQRKEMRSSLTPAYIKWMRWGGLSASIIGSTLMIGSVISYDKGLLTRKKWQTLRTMSDVGVGLTVIGASAFILSFPLSPSWSDEQIDAKIAADESITFSDQLHWQVGLTTQADIALRGTF